MTGHYVSVLYRPRSEGAFRLMRRLSGIVAEYTTQLRLIRWMFLEFPLPIPGETGIHDFRRGIRGGYGCRPVAGQATMTAP